MKILIVANGYPTQQDPQWGCFERDQAIALKKIGHEIAILAVDTRYRSYRRKRGVSIIHTVFFTVYWGYWFPTRPLRYISSRFSNWVTSHLYNRVYSRLVKDFGTPELIYAHFQRNIFFSMFLKKKYSIPLVGMEHWSVLLQKQIPSFVNQRCMMAYPNLDKLLVVSVALSKSLQTKFGVNPTVVYDMLGPEFLEYKTDGRRLSAGVRFIAVGSLFPIKGYDLLIKAFARTHLAERNCSLMIIGDGSERETLEQIIVEYGLKDSVLMPGRKQKDEIVMALRNSDVFVLSSRSETFGVACIEAMSQGLPCIATRCGGPEEFVSDKDGILIKSEDQTEMEKALLYMFDNHTKYNRNDISSRCLSRFSPAAIALQLTGIFKEVINSSNDNK